MQKQMDPHLKFQIDVNSAGNSSANNGTASTSDAQEPPLTLQPTMPPPSTDWSNQFNSPEAVSPKATGIKCFSPYSQEDMGPFVEQLLPFVRAGAYNWFHLQAAKRKYLKEFDKRMTSEEENSKLVELQGKFQNDRDDLKVKWASRLLGKIKKDIFTDHKDAFVSVITGVEPDKCIVSVADHKGKMRRIDCLRQADKVWRLDLVTIILFKGIPLESTDGERLERTGSCTDGLCINPFHMSISIRCLDIYMAGYLKNVDTKITIAYGTKIDEGSELNAFIKQEPAETSIVAPHAVLATSATHNRVWESSPVPTGESVILSYDPIKASHTYFGGRATLQQSLPNPYAYLANKHAIDNNYFDPKRSVLCMPPPPPQSCFSSASTSDSQQMEISEDSNDVPSEKRSRDMSSHDSPGSSTNEEVRRFADNSDKLILGQSSTIWIPSNQYSRVQPNQEGPGPSRQVRQAPDFRSHDHGRNIGFRAAKPIRRMTVNAGNHGDVGVLVVDERNNQEAHAQTLVNALSTLCTTQTSMRDSPAGRKRAHPDPFDYLGCDQDLKNSLIPGSDVSPPHAAVSNLISRESSGYMASPTKFTTARGDTTSFSKIFQKVEEKHGQQQNQPSTSFCSSQILPPILSSKPVDSSVKIIAPVALKPSMLPLSACNSIIGSPITTPRITPYRMLEDDSLINALGLANSNDSTLHETFLQHFIGQNSRSPLLNSAASFPALTMGLQQASSTNQQDGSASNGSNSLGGAMGLIVTPSIALAVSQAPTTMSPLLHMGVGIGIPSACSPSSSNSSLGAANQAPISNTPKDPNAPKLPTDFAQALRNEKKQTF